MNAREGGAALRIGIVGAGFFARFQIAAWKRLSGASLAAVCDLDEGRRAWVAEHHPEAAVHERVEAMLDAGGIDVLDIATPPASRSRSTRTSAEEAIYRAHAEGRRVEV